MKRESNKRKYPGEDGARPDNAKLRRDEAEARQKAYDKLSIREKVEKLDEKLGITQGASRQRAKLLAQLEKSLPGAKEHDALVGLVGNVTKTNEKGK